MDCFAAYSVVSISDFKVKDGMEVEEGTGSGIVWDRYQPHHSSGFLICSACKQNVCLLPVNLIS